MHCYISKDLYNWEDKGLIIPSQPDDLQSPLHPTYCMDGSHIVYYEKTGKYVASVTSKFMSVMQADYFFGLYEFVHKTYKALKVDTGDFTLQFDEKSDIAYFIFEHLHLELVTTTFSDNYTGKPTATVHKGSACVFQTKRRALFLHFGNKWILPESIKGGGI